MNRLFPLLILSAAPAFSQMPADPPQPPDAIQPGAPAPALGASSSTSSRISHVVAGPDGRAQGLLLRNGIFVNLAPGLAQQIPADLQRNSSVKVSGPIMGSGADKTMQAQQIVIAGVSYSDVPLPGGRSIAPQPDGNPPPPEPRGRRGVAPPPPAGPGPRPPAPPPCDRGPVPPPPSAAPAPPPPPPEAGAPAPPADGAPAPAAPHPDNLPAPTPRN